MALLGWGNLLDPLGVGSRTAKPDTHFGNDNSKNLYSAGIKGKGSNEKYFPLVDKESGMVTIYNQNWDRPDTPVAIYDPVTKTIKPTPYASKVERAAFGNVDNGNDIVAKGAFTKSLADRPASKIKLLSQHKTDEPIGIFTEVFEDSKGLFVRGKLALGTQKGRETYELMKLGAIDGMSIGFRANPEKQIYNESKRTRTLKEVQLLEISLVTFPMNERAMVQSIKGEKSIREWETILRDAGGLSRTEAKVGAKDLMDALNHRDDDTKQLADLIYKVANILTNKQTNI